MSKKIKTSKKDFQIFVDECKRIQRLFGFNDWKLFYEHTQLKGAYACICYDADERTATLSLNTEILQAEIKDWDVLDSAKHEMCHLLLADLEGVGRKRWVHKDEMYKQSEALAQRLTDLIKV